MRQVLKHLDRFSRFCTAHGRESQYFTTGPIFPVKIENCPFPWGDLDPHLTRSSLDSLEFSAQTASRSVQPFLQG